MGRLRSTRDRQDASDLPLIPVADRTVGRTSAAPSGVKNRLYMFVTLTPTSYSKVISGPGVPVSRCPGVPVSRCPGVPVSRCPGVPVNRSGTTAAARPWMHQFPKHVGRWVLASPTKPYEGGALRHRATLVPSASPTTGPRLVRDTPISDDDCLAAPPASTKTSLQQRRSGHASTPLAATRRAERAVPRHLRLRGRSIPRRRHGAVTFGDGAWGFCKRRGRHAANGFPNDGAPGPTHPHRGTTVNGWLCWPP